MSEAGGYATMKLILAANAQVDVVLGADTVVLGALRALREAGKDRPRMFLGGIDGEPQAVAEIEVALESVGVESVATAFFFALAAQDLNARPVLQVRHLEGL